MWITDTDYELTPRIHDEDLPRTVYLLYKSGRKRAYTRPRDVLSAIRGCSPEQLEEIKVFLHRTEIHIGLHGWIDVSDEFRAKVSQ
mgnify:FL=1|jgi:hypothetical protein